MFTGIVGFIATLIAGYGESLKDVINITFARFLGVLAGIVLTIILGGYVVVSFSAIFAALLAVGAVIPLFLLGWLFAKS